MLRISNQEIGDMFHSTMKDTHPRRRGVTWRQVPARRRWFTTRSQRIDILVRSTVDLQIAPCYLI
jgi:hypothetical protein